MMTKVLFKIKILIVKIQQKAIYAA